MKWPPETYAGKGVGFGITSACGMALYGGLTTGHWEAAVLTGIMFGLMGGPLFAWGLRSFYGERPTRSRWSYLKTRPRPLGWLLAAGIVAAAISLATVDMSSGSRFAISGVAFAMTLTLLVLDRRNQD